MTHHPFNLKFFFALYLGGVRAITRCDKLGGGVYNCILVSACSHTVKTITFKINLLGRTQIYEYAPLPQLLCLVMALGGVIKK